MHHSHPTPIHGIDNTSDPIAVPHMAEMLEKVARLLDQRCDAIERKISAIQSVTPQSIDRHSLMEPHNVIPDLGVIQHLLDDLTINDILINGHNEIYVERAGVLQKVDTTFPDHETLLTFAEKIVKSIGRDLDPTRPIVDARLPDGSRVNIIAPPLAIDGVSISIRKFVKGKYSIDVLAQNGSMIQQAADFLKTAAKAKLNIVISGGTGSGKTTMLNAIAQHIPPTERVVTIEDSAELQLPIPHVVRLESMEGNQTLYKAVPMRDLVKNALRMRPDRVIIGEVRGAEAFDMIQAMNTGHEGSLATIHANTARDGLARIENMIGMANLNIPPMAVRKQIASAVNLIVQVTRLDDGKRCVTQIAEIVGTEGDVITMQDIFALKQNVVNGTVENKMVWTNVFPRHKTLSRMLREANMLSSPMM
ncbi:MAG: CpaF family protein [Rickettsiales bacterium]